jgi:hypothetical protein
VTATAADSALAAGWTLVGICVILVVIDWLIAWVRGERSIRDRDGRLRPVAAVGLSLAVVFGVGALLATVLQ